MATPLFTGKHPDEVQRTFIPRRLFNGDLVQRTNAQDHSLGRPDGASMPRFLGEEPRPPPLEGPQAGEPGAYSWPLHPLRPALSRDPEQRPTIAEAPRRTNTKLPRYNGENPLETYLVQVRLAANLNGWSAEETGVQVALALEGKALQVLVDLPPEEHASWTAIEAALQRRYGRRVFTDDARDQLASRRRGDVESLGAFAADLRLYARRGYPTFNQSQQDELALQAFVRGVQPERLREHIRLSTPRSLVSALDEAERVEDILCATETRHRIRQVEMSEDEEELELTRQASANPPQRSWRGPKRATRNEGCYRCGEPGHVSRNCPAPAPRAHLN